jgi:ADP-heptose:LPS heptosyltransferase
MKILVIRFSSIGDVVLTTPILRCMKEQLKNVEIHFVTKKVFASVLSHNPYITKLVTIEKSTNEVFAQLKAEKYDVVIDLHKNIRTLFLRKRLGVTSYTFPKLNFQKWLLVTFKRNKMPNLHVVDRYFEAVKAIGVSSDLQPGDYFLFPKEVVDMQKLGLEIKTYVAIAIGAQFVTKILPTEKLVEIIEKLELPVVLLGGEKDVRRAKEICALVKNKTLVNAVNHYSLNQSASIVAQSKVLLTHDTGLMHIAACFDLPIVSVWGNTVPSLGMYPYYPQHPEKFVMHEVNNLTCRPCSKIGYHSCPMKHFRCMELQDVDAIAADVNRFSK